MLKVWIPGTTDVRDQGLSGTEWINDNVTVVNDGKLGKCLSFNGSNSRLSTTGFELSNKWSFSAWVKCDSATASWMSIFALGDSNDANLQTSFIMYPAQNRIQISFNGTYESSLAFTSPTEWMHYAATYDGEKLKYYVNGEQLSNIGNTRAYMPKTNLTIGGESNSADGGGHAAIRLPFSGLINDFRIWDNEIISPKIIKMLSQGMIAHYPLNRSGFGQDNIIPNTWPEERTFEYPTTSYSDKFSPITTIIPAASQYILSFWAKSTVDDDQIRAHFYSPNTTTYIETNQGHKSSSADGRADFTLSTSWKRYWVIWTQNETTAVKHVICPRLGSVGNTYNIVSGTGTISMKMIKLEEGNIPTPWIPNSADSLYSGVGLDDGIVYDVSGYQNNLELYTESGGASPEYLSDTPRYNVCTKIDGSHQYLRGTCQTSSVKTVSFWVKTSQTGNVAIFTDPKSKIGFGVYGGYIIAATDGYTTTFVRSGFNYGQWNHVVIIKNDDNSRQLYINGVAQEVNGTKTDAWTDRGDYLILFRRGYNSTYASTDAMLSDFRMYSTQLTEDDILDLYNVGASIVNNGTLLSYELEEST